MTFDDIGVVLKLVSGETVICQVVSDTDKNLLIKDPYIINVITEKSEDGIKASTFYSDWFLGSATRVHMIRKDHIISAALPDENLTTHYGELVGIRDLKEGGNAAPVEKKQPKSFWDSLNFGQDGLDYRNN